VPGAAPPVERPPVPAVAPPFEEPPVPGAAPPLAEPPIPDAPPAASRPPVVVTPPVPGLPPVPGFPPEIPAPPAPAPALVPAGEPPDDEQEAAAKKKRTKIQDAVSDFMLLLWLFSPSGRTSAPFSLPKRALTSRHRARGKGRPQFCQGARGRRCRRGLGCVRQSPLQLSTFGGSRACGRHNSNWRCNQSLSKSSVKPAACPTATRAWARSARASRYARWTADAVRWAIRTSTKLASPCS